jgi:hypothetical protein
MSNEPSQHMSSRPYGIGRTTFLEAILDAQIIQGNIELFDQLEWADCIPERCLILDTWLMHWISQE